MLTNIEKVEYRKNDGKTCPYCKAINSVMLSSKREETHIINNNKSIQEMKCKKCGKHWKEIYPMFDIEEMED